MTAPDGPARFALYWAPDVDDPLHEAAATWLGRDPETGAARPQPDLPDLPAITADARRYGFHATLKAPFRLAAGTTYAALRTTAAALAARTAPFDLPPLAVGDLDGYMALRETRPCPKLHALADAAIAGLDAHRAPADRWELDRRASARLTDAERAMLERWGYPAAFATWYFHMTLSRRLDADEQARLRPAAEAHFAPALARPRRVTAVALFSEARPGAPFLIAERLPLLGRA